MKVGERSCISLDYGVDLAHTENRKSEDIQTTTERKYKSVQDTIVLINECEDISKESLENVIVKSTGNTF